LAVWVDDEAINGGAVAEVVDVESTVAYPATVGVDRQTVQLPMRFFFTNELRLEDLQVVNRFKVMRCMIKR
jgi:hypothetical protein